jgi:hypothetical protein
MYKPNCLAVATTLAVAAFVGLPGAAFAQEANPVTREQVRAELAEAIRTGDILSGDSGLTLRERFPQRYPAPVAAPGKTRGQVRAELEAAIRDGEIVSGDSGLTLREQFPQRYQAVATAPAKSRAQVRAELDEALRTGDVYTGESGRKLNELNPQRYSRAETPRTDGSGTTVDATDTATP